MTAPVQIKPVTREPLPPEELERRKQASRQMAATVGDITGLLAMSPRHQDHKLSDLRWLVLPAVRTGQYAVTDVQSTSRGYTFPAAMVLWASVSAEVDKRLSQDLQTPIRLSPREWKSGNILWLVDAVGEDKVVASMVKRLRQNEWKGRPLKARVVGANGETRVKVIEPLEPKASAPSLKH